MKIIMLLFVFTAWDNGLEYTNSVTVRGYPDMVACERHLSALQRSIPEGTEVTKADCFVAIR